MSYPSHYINSHTSSSFLHSHQLLSSMVGMEEILCELERDHEMSEQGLPPGFRFHPTDEELVTFYLASKVFNATFSGFEIAEVDLNRCEPWELPDKAKLGEREWYFFSLRDRKYPTGLRTNRATGAGYWKATGKDREVLSAANGALLGMKKTLVFYKGRAPRGEKTKWVMHEYRLDGDFSCRHTGKEEWVICRMFHKLGERKNLMQGQNYLMRASSFYNPTSLPPLLEPPPSLEDQSPLLQNINNQFPNQNQSQNPLLYHAQESELKALISPLVARPDILTGSSSSTRSESKEAMLLKPFMWSQDFSFKELRNAISKQCKKESDLSLQFGGENSKYYQNPFILGGSMGIPSVTVDDHSVTAAMDAASVDNVMSTEPAFRWW